MPIDKENVETPTKHEVKKRPSMESPYTSGTPSTRPGPRKQLRPLRELGDQNLEASQFFDETLNMSSVKAELEGSVAQELASVGIDSIVHRADPNIEESFVESDAPMTQMKENRNVRSCDSNLEDSAIESTMCEMDNREMTVEVEALTPHKLLHETFVLAEDEADTTLKNEEPLAAEAIGLNAENTTEEATQRLDTTRDEESPKSDTVICGSVEAVLLYENNGAPLPLDEGSLARELSDLGDGEKAKSGMEVVGSVNISIVNPEPSQKETLPCVSDLSSTFSFSSHVSCARGVGGDDVNLSGKDSFNDLNETELVFAVPLAKAGNPPHDKREDTSLGCADYTAITDSSLMDITTGIEETMMVLTEPEKAAALLANNDVFPAHYGSSEVEGRVSRPESTATAIAYESLTQYQTAIFDTGDQEMVIQGEDAQIVLLEGAKPKDEEILAEDTKSGASDRITERCSSSKSSAALRYKSPLSPIADLSRGGATSRTSNAASSFGSQSSTPVLPVNRKYNMNDSEISFLINEVKVLAEEEGRLRNSKSPSEIEQMAMNMAKLEAEKAELHANLRAVSTEMNKYKEKSAAQDAALAEADKKLNELERAREHAEKTIEDYEFIVENLKKNHVKQKEDLHAKLIAQEEELEKCHAVIRSQADLTYTSAGLSAELAVTSERLLESEAARVAAQKRCEELAEELDKAMNATTTVAVSEEAITNANRDLAAMRERLTELENEVLEREQALLTADRRHAEECITLQEKLNETASALELREKAFEDLKNQLSTANSEMTILREIQIASEMDLMKTADELKAVKCILEEKEQACKEAVHQRSAAEEELTNLRQQLNDKLEFFEKEMAQLGNLKEACAALEEQLEAEKRARDIASREVEQLRDEKCIVEEALDKAEKASKDAEQRIVEAERNLADHIKCHTEKFEHRISELESAIALSSADKEALTSQLEESLKKEAELTTEVMKASEAISKLETDMADAERDKAALEEKVKLGMDMYNEKIAEIEKVAADAAELQTFLKSLELERDRFKEELEAAVEKAQKTEMESQQVIVSMKAELATLSDDRDSLKTSLAEVEVNKANIEKDLIELGECAFKSQEKIAALIAELAKSEEEWKDKEKEYQARIVATEEVAKKVPQLEKTADYLKAETVTLNNTIKEVSSKLLAEAESKREATKALTVLEEQHSSLWEEKKVIEKEYEEAKARFDAELTTAHNEARNLKEEMVLLEERFAREKSAANTKIEATTAELSRLNAELRESKVAQAEAEAQATEYRQKSEELMEKCATLESKLGEAANEKSEQNSKDIEKELKELERLVELKEREINRLGDLCDEFDEVEDNYKKKVFGLLDENEKLKTQLGLITKPEVPNLRAALTEGVQILTPETTLVPNGDREEKLKDLEKKVDQLTKENARLEQNCKDIENEMKEWKHLVELKEREINRLGDLCDEFDEVEDNYKKKVFGLLDENEKLKTQLGLITKPEVPNLRAALTEGVPMLTPETTLVPSNDRASEEKLKELEKMVDQLTRENARLEQLKKTEYAKLAKETVELRRHCKIQENRISELEKICDDADESESKLKQRIAELEKQISPTKVPDEKSKSKIPQPRLLDALGPKEVNGERSTEQAGVAKEESYVSASSSPPLLQKSLDRTAGPMFEESVVENSATPNRSLHTTLYKKLDKTAKLSDSVESKANTSRCAQQ